jgi:imidazolonepropionase-like amidohydrolase
MEEAGLSPVAVINCATGAGAGRFVYREAIGRIEAGYRSRFTLTRYSPVEAVANLRKPRAVVFDGAVYETGGGGAGTEGY